MRNSYRVLSKASGGYVGQKEVARALGIEIRTLQKWLSWWGINWPPTEPLPGWAVEYDLDEPPDIVQRYLFEPDE